MSKFKNYRYEHPLIAFSFYTDVQSQSLVRLGKKLNLISARWDGRTIYDFGDYYDQFWLWILGAYEVVRTMDQNSYCFVEGRRPEIAKLKRILAIWRMPFAKQELRRAFRLRD